MDERDNINDCYYYFYEMMIQALKTDDVVGGINKSLYLLKMCLDCDDILLHKKDENGCFNYFQSQARMNNLVDPISQIVNRTSHICKENKVVRLDADYLNMVLLFLKTDENDYILSINNTRTEYLNSNEFLKKLEEMMLIILKRAEMYEKNIRAITIDLLTGLENRNSYEIRKKEFEEFGAEIVYGIFDLFRLKYINDNFSHEAGDRYIQGAARILSKYWPSEKTIITPNGIRKKESTGHSLFRIGGDEFVLLSKKDTLKKAKEKAEFARIEATKINLDLECSSVITGINYGITPFLPTQTIKEVYMEADKLMSEDKKQMYLKLGIDRRK